MNAALRLYHPQDTNRPGLPIRLRLDIIEMHERYLIAPADIARELGVSETCVATTITRYYASNRRIVIPSRINLM